MRACTGLSHPCKHVNTSILICTYHRVLVYRSSVLVCYVYVAVPLLCTILLWSFDKVTLFSVCPMRLKSVLEKTLVRL